MSELLDIIIQAVDNASDTFQSITGSAEDMVDSITSSTDEGSSDFEEMESAAESASESIEDVANSASSIDGSSIEEAATAADDLEQEALEAADAMEQLGSAGDVMAAQTLMEMSEGLTDSMMNMANAAGSFNDSMTRMGLAAEGAGIDVDSMKSAVTNLASETGRAGGSIRESFIAMTSAGISDMGTMETLFKGASAQAFILGTDVETLANKFSGMAMKSTIAERTLKGTGITVEELGQALGMQGATIDQINAKWETMSVDQRAAALGMAASMNEGKNANEEYKHSWQGLQAQLEIAQGRLQRLAGEVLLPVLVPAMEIASSVLNAFGDAVSFLMSGPLGGLISILGTAAGAAMIGVTAFGALKSILGFLRVEATLAAIETTALAVAEELQAGGSIASVAANLLASSGFGTLAASAWAAATAVWAVIAPFLPFIAIGAAIILIIYEIGKAFNWWHDAGSMIEAISAGIQRLWSAFINHPDVQAAISAISNAFQILWNAIQGVGQAVLEFFGITTGGNFDIVRALIDGIGNAWNMIKEPVLAYIDIITTLFSVIYEVLTGHMDLETAIMTIWDTLATNVPIILMALANVFITVWSGILGFVWSIASRIVMGVVSYLSQLPLRVYQYLVQVWNHFVSVGMQWVSQARSRASQVLNGIVSYLRQLPGRALSALLGVVSSIVSAGSQWLSNARSQAQSIVDGVAGVLAATPGRVASALSGVVDAIVKPFRDAYNTAKGWWDKIVGMASNTPSVASAGETGVNVGLNAYTMDSELLVSSDSIVTHEIEDSSVSVDGEVTIVHDLRNVPSGVDEDTLIEALTSRDTISALVNNSTFQKLDSQVKESISLKNGRARGV